MITGTNRPLQRLLLSALRLPWQLSSLLHPVARRHDISLHCIIGRIRAVPLGQYSLIEGPNAGWRSVSTQSKHQPTPVATRATPLRNVPESSSNRARFNRHCGYFALKVMNFASERTDFEFKMISRLLHRAVVIRMLYYNEIVIFQ